MFQFAILSDIHGNRWALEAVLGDIFDKRIKTIVNLGDSLYGPLDPSGTARILMGLDMISVSGNEDSSSSPLIKFMRDKLSTEQVEWLRSQKKIESLNNGILLFHGAFENDREYLVYNVLKTGVILKNREQLSQKFERRKESLFLYGHDHTANVIHIQDRKLLVNPGSVGLQAYVENLPHPHCIENGSPHARYCVLSKTASGWHIEQNIIPYDHESASKLAIENEYSDWGFWLKTGWTK